MPDYTVTIESNNREVSGIPCKSLNHAKKLMRIIPTPDKFRNGRFIKLQVVQEGR